MVTGSIFEILRGAIYDGPGIRTVVFFKGCPLRCRWCSNPESLTKSKQLLYDKSKCIKCFDCISVCPEKVFQKVDGKLSVDFEKCTGCKKCLAECYSKALRVYGWETDVQDVMKVVLKDNKYYKNSGGGITLSGGEPLYQPEFCLALLKESKNNNINTCIETSGYSSAEVIKSIIPYTDTFLFDYKLYDDKLHIQNIKVSNKSILESLDIICKSGSNVILRCPIIPKINDNTKHFQAIADISNKYESIKSVEIMAYHDYGSHKYEQLGLAPYPIKEPSSSPELKAKWKKALREAGCRKLV